MPKKAEWEKAAEARCSKRKGATAEGFGKKPAVSKHGKPLQAEQHMALVKLPEKQLLKFFSRKNVALVSDISPAVSALCFASYFDVAVS